MLIVLSPAKTLDFETAPPISDFTQSDLLVESELLINKCKTLSVEDIISLMKVSTKIATLNEKRFSSWELPLTLGKAKQALFAFQGEVYTGLQAQTLPNKTLHYAQQHLRILSGLYGLLRPLDLMHAYRLEMGIRLENVRGVNLYQFWGTRVSEAINNVLQAQGDNILINLASMEYFKVLKNNALSARVITPIFKDQKNGQYKVISFYAKKARGLMARYILENEVQDIAQLKEFAVDGYYFVEQNLQENELLFYRDEK
ncbi:peroxide stress protein YaaA [Psychromonas sp. CD1]|uniref:peroxide stress protein YaaA n=1 Tax=Psychromonas sp. CD1 TaxID=1979839 RepID=UPI000B9C72FB|nr:peroxide stress protein YaaA [Psychromonas sp. CD1]